MTKNATQRDVAFLKESLEDIANYVDEIQEHLILLDMIATAKPRKAKFLLKLFLQNVESHLSEVKSLAFLSAKRLPGLEKDN